MVSARIFAVVLACLTSLCQAQNSSLPVVDLGYERHRAIRLDNASRAYNFSNIRFGKAPIGDLRFREPVPAWHAPNDTTVNDGSKGVICPQAQPLWQTVTAEYFAALQQNSTLNVTAASNAIFGNATILESARRNLSDPRENEDCLFLDVVVPEGIYKNASKGYGAPVLFYIFGGGYTEGEKSSNGLTDPTGLFAAAQNATGEQFIWVAINYRLGAFGWLPGATVSTDGTPNAALYDQRLALDWVEKYIHLFGGDKSRVTVMGESAGGGSIMHLITAFNGQKGTKFAQAIPQSPGWLPSLSNYKQEQVYRSFLQYANASSLAELRNMSTEQLQRANFNQVANSAYSTFSYGPVVDGIIAPQLPGRALLSGNFDPKLRILPTHVSDEGATFTAPNITTAQDYDTFVSQYFTGANTAASEFITKTLYPPVNNSTTPYSTNQQRAILTVSEAIFTCNTYYLAKAYKNQTHNLQFSVPPGFHGSDVTFDFARDPSAAPVPIAAKALQQYFTTFVIKGVPSNLNSPDLPRFPIYGNNATLINVNSTISTMRDSNASPQCDYWQQALYF